MSWSVSEKISNVSEIESLSPAYEIGEGSKKQLAKAKEVATQLIEVIEHDGKQLNVSLSGHCQADSPGSGTDSIYISIGIVFG